MHIAHRALGLQYQNVPFYNTTCSIVDTRRIQKTTGQLTFFLQILETLSIVELFGHCRYSDELLCGSTDLETGAPGLHRGGGGSKQ